MIKKLFFLSLSLSLALSAGVAYAQESTAGLPNIYIRTITLPKTSYAAGDTVTGTFSLINGDNVNVPNVVYKVSLADAPQKNGLITTIYDSKTFDPVILAPSEKKTISFSYTLPQSFSGKNMDIHIQAFLTSGVPLGWGDMPISVTGGLPTLSLTKALLTIDKQTFPLGAGPTMYPGTTTISTLNINVSNSSGSAIAVTPHFKIYDRSVTGKLLKEYDATSSLSVSAKGKAAASYQLETMNNTPGVYLGIVTFPDTQGISRMVPVSFRYIVYGDIVTINSVTASRATVQKGDALPLVINYSGTPYDILTNNTSSVGSDNATLNVSVYNELDQVVGTYTGTNDFNQGTSQTIQITAAVPAQALRAEVTVTKNGTTLASYSSNLTANYDQARQQALNNPSKPGPSRLTYIFYIVGGIIVLFALIILIIRIINMRRGMTLMILLALLFSFGFGFSQQTDAYTQTGRHSYNAVWDYSGFNYNNGNYPANNGSTPDYTNSCGNEPQGYTSTDGSHWHVHGCQTRTHAVEDFSPQVTISSPGDIDTLAPGSTFYLQGTAFVIACLNNPEDVVVTATYNSQTISKTYTNVNNFNGGASDSQTGVPFSVGPFTVQSTAGTSTLSFEVDNYTNVPNNNPTNGSTNINSYNNTINPSTGASYGSNPATKDKPQPQSPAGVVFVAADIGGYMTGTMTITAGGVPPTVTLVPQTPTINYGDPDAVSWTTTNSPTVCKATLGDSGWPPSNPSVNGGTYSIPAQTLFVTTSYKITCSNAAGTASAIATINVNACVSRANNTGEVGNALLALSGGSGSPSGSGGTGGGGPAPCPNNPGNPTTPVVSLYANPISVPSGTNSTLTWNSNNIDSGGSCTGTGFNTNGQTNNSLGVSVGPITTTTTYSIVCVNSSGVSSNTASVTVTVSQTASATCIPTTAASPNNAVSSVEVDTPVTWKASVTGPYSSVQWVGTDIPPNATGLTYPITYTSVGTKSISLVVTMNDGTQQTFCKTSVPPTDINTIDVKPPSTFQEI